MKISMEKSAAFLKYIDIFGTKCTFYNEKMPKLYTVMGGIFSILSLLISLSLFIIFSLDDLKQKYPLSTTSSIPSDKYKKFKFGKQKIWIPWRIVDYNNNEYINHTGVLFPIIYYYSGIKNTNTKQFNLTKKIINYKLCNETSMAKENIIQKISVPLNEIYCIDMEDLEMGGSWITEFINYVQFDIYYCQDGINYDEKNPKCTSYDKLRKFVGENNSLEFDLYYPIIQFQPTNKTNPVIIFYRQHYYHLSKYVNKIDRLYLQENVLTDDSGFILTKEINSSYLGLNLITGETYFSGEKDLINEGSNSRAYSFNIYLDPNIIIYKRYYKKFYSIFSDFFPFGIIIITFLKNISKLFKKVENNKKMVELLFENLNEKSNELEDNLQKLRIKSNYFKYGRLSFNRNNYKIINDINLLKKKKFSIDLSLGCNNVSNHSFKIVNKNTFGSRYSNRNLNISPNKSQHIKKINVHNSSKYNLILNEPYYRIKNNSELFKKNEQSYKSCSLRKNIIKEKLFPYKYYFFSIFIKNINISKGNNFLFSSRFSKIYIFLCQLIDITTYISLIREFNALKKFFNEKSVNKIEKRKKINISSKSFIKEISDNIEDKNFHILAQ